MFNLQVESGDCNFYNSQKLNILQGGFSALFYGEIMTQDATVIAQMRQLIQLLAKHNHAYYVMDQPSIEDSEYDQLFHQLKALEQQYPDLIIRTTCLLLPAVLKSVCRIKKLNMMLN